MGWSFARIPRMAAAVMRTAMYEVLYMPAIPNSAAINEAVEIAKNYEPAEVVSFINGILGSFVRAEFADSAPSRKRRRRKRRGRRSRRNDHAGSGTGYQQLYHLRSRL